MDVVTQKAILIVDDDVDDIDFFEEALKSRADCPIIRFSNGKVVVDYLSRKNVLEDIGLVVLDLNMPLKDGFEVLAFLRQKSKDIPVAVLTASLRQSDEFRCYDLGCNVYLRKPSTMRDYERVVSRIMRLI